MLILSRSDCGMIETTVTNKKQLIAALRCVAGTNAPCVITLERKDGGKTVYLFDYSDRYLSPVVIERRIDQFVQRVRQTPKNVFE